MDDFNGGIGGGGMGAGPGMAAWGLFALTGGIGYYLLHKELNGEHDDPGRDKRLD